MNMIAHPQRPDGFAQRLAELGEQMSTLARDLSEGKVESADAHKVVALFPFRATDDEGRVVGGDEVMPRRSARPSLPDPRLIRRMIRRRRQRSRFFGGELFADPAWDMLLDLTAARAEHRRVSITSLCLASGVPTTTAHRWLGQLLESGLVERVEDDSDRRRIFVALTDAAALTMARYFDEIDADALAAV